MIENLAKLGDTFTIEDAVRVSETERSIVRVILSRLEKRGWIERIERGKYIIIPLSSEKGRMTLHEFQIGSLIIEPYAISYWSALNHHGLTEQIPVTVFLQTTSRKKNMRPTIFGVDYRIVRLSSMKFFGFDREWIDNTPIYITNPEKTLVDCLDKPQFCGGVIEIIKAFPNENLNIDLLLRYAEQMHNSGILRRLGYISDHHNLGLDVNIPETRNYLYADPTLPHIGKKISKWRIIDNLEPMVRGGLE